ncbi:uncharacterized protein METZ01_LOCUS161919, partial [marine metagenome]
RIATYRGHRVGAARQGRPRTGVRQHGCGAGTKSAVGPHFEGDGVHAHRRQELGQSHRDSGPRHSPERHRRLLQPEDRRHLGARRQSGLRPGVPEGGAGDRRQGQVPDSRTSLRAGSGQLRSVAEGDQVHHGRSVLVAEPRDSQVARAGVCLRKVGGVGQSEGRTRVELGDVEAHGEQKPDRPPGADEHGIGLRHAGRRGAGRHEGARGNGAVSACKKRNQRTADSHSDGIHLPAAWPSGQMHRVSGESKGQAARHGDWRVENRCHVGSGEGSRSLQGDRPV